MTSSVLDVTNASVRFDGALALDGVDLAVERGETVAIIGPSGCGKSTLLRAIAGLQPLDTGAIAIDGRDVANVPSHERGVGLMFQDHALFPHLDVAANVSFGLEMAGVSGSERSDRVAEMLELVGLGGFDRRSIDGLSGGEAQRVALARALAPSPALLMLDEPLGSLDRVLREQLTGDLRTLIDRIGATTLHVTHDQTEAFALADRVVVLRDGRIEQSGTPSELWHRPASRFVAEFVGHSNLWPNGDGSIDVVPITAVRLDPAGDLEVTVQSATFRDGRHLIESTRGDGVVVSFEAADAIEVGSTVRLAYSVGVTVADLPTPSSQGPSVS